MIDDEISMPFGKHKGEPVSELPLRYCRWLYKNCDLFGEVEQAICKRLKIEPVAKVKTQDAIVVETMASGTDYWKEYK